ncbi:MAG: hypothetical protein JW779_05550 [Candidatus Thorarchaeota archaeon]|nr:hypothetical protein [Candidatus Thorarchaeota archaeon]
MVETYEGISQDSTRKILDSKDILKRQERVLDVFKVLDDLKLAELKDVSLVEQAELLPVESKPRMLAEGKIVNLPAQQGLSPSSSEVGGVVGAGIGGLVGLLIAKAAKDENYVAWAGLGAAIGGAIGSLIGSYWKSGA